MKQHTTHPEERGCLSRETLSGLNSLVEASENEGTEMAPGDNPH